MIHELLICKVKLLLICNVKLTARHLMKSFKLMFFSSQIRIRVGNRPGRPTGAYDLACLIDRPRLRLFRKLV